MDAQAMITELNDHGFTDESTTAKTRVLQHTVWDIEGREQWPYLEDSATLTFDGSSSVPQNVPEDFRAVISLQHINGFRLTWVRLEELEDIAMGNYTGSGQPRNFYLVGNQLNIYPVPGASDTVKLRYLKWSPAITDTSAESAFLIPKQFHRLIVYGALWRLYDMEDDPELSQRFEMHFETGLDRMRAVMWQKQFDSPEHIAVIDVDDWTWDY